MAKARWPEIDEKKPRKLTTSGVGFAKGLKNARSNPMSETQPRKDEPAPQRRADDFTFSRVIEEIDRDKVNRAEKSPVRKASAKQSPKPPLARNPLPKPHQEPAL